MGLPDLLTLLQNTHAPCANHENHYVGGTCWVQAIVPILWPTLFFWLAHTMHMPQIPHRHFTGHNHLDPTCSKGCNYIFHLACFRLFLVP
jgi:hypothetical protein